MYQRFRGYLGLLVRANVVTVRPLRLFSAYPRENEQACAKLYHGNAADAASGESPVPPAQSPTLGA
jgi:hypothetical protein